MKKKKIVIGSVLIISILIILVVFFNISTGEVKNVDNKLEIQPEEEISNNQELDTKIKLFYIDKISGQVVAENRDIDVRNLVDNPYVFLINELLKGPESEDLELNIPKETKVNSAYLSKGVLTIDFNEKVLECKNPDDIYCIVNTMCEFNEVDSVKITINGETNEMYKDAFVKKK